jgi:hypothetical protein
MEDTNIPDPEELDALLREHLAAELNPQLGRAARHFRHHLATHGAGPSTHPASPPRRALGGWVVGIVGGAMAASIAALWAGPALWSANPDAPHRVGIATTPAHAIAPTPADYHFDLDDVTLSTRTRDGGTVLLDGRTPARRIYRDELKEVRWVDPKHDASFEQIEPRRNIMLIEMDTY